MSICFAFFQFVGHFYTFTKHYMMCLDTATRLDTATLPSFYNIHKLIYYSAEKALTFFHAKLQYLGNTQTQPIPSNNNHLSKIRGACPTPVPVIAAWSCHQQNFVHASLYGHNGSAIRLQLQIIPRRRPIYAAVPESQIASNIFLVYSVQKVSLHFCRQRKLAMNGKDSHPCNKVMAEKETGKRFFLTHKKENVTTAHHLDSRGLP
jgi:hypothetical protein